MKAATGKAHHSTQLLTMSDKNASQNEQAAGDDLSGRKEVRPIHLCPEDAAELERVVSARGGYKNVLHLLRDFLFRSLLPRIEEGRYFPGRLLTETAGRRSAEERPAGGSSRSQVQIGLESWAPVAAAASKVRRDLRRLEERRAWEGGAGPLPFYRVGMAEVVRAAAREIGTWSRGGPPELLSQEEAASWLGPGLSPTGNSSTESSSTRSSSTGNPGDDEGLGEKSSSEKPNSQKPKSEKPKRPSEASGERAQSRGAQSRGARSREATYQVLAKLPGRDRGGKPVQFYVTEEAKTRLKAKGARLHQTASDLLRRGTRLLVGWAERGPAEAYRHISEESELYQGPREGSGSGFQVYVSAETKRRVEEAKARLKRKPGYGAEADQTGILQAAARLALEAEDQKMRPPLPGATGARSTGAGPTEAGPDR